MRLAIVTTHPVQYYAPIFRLLQQRQKIEIMVFYTWGKAALSKYDPGFKKQVDWDIPLLEGYAYQWVKNTANDPGSHHPSGVVNPDLINDIAAWNPDTILIFGWAYRSHLKVLRYFKNKLPILFRGDSTLLDEKKGIKNLLKTLYLRWVYKHVDVVLYNGIANKAYFKKYGLKDDQLIFVPHAVDNLRFKGNAQTELGANALRNDLGIDKEDIVILFAGKFERKKDPLTLMNSFLMLNDPKVHLLFVGDGELDMQLKENAYGRLHVHFLGFQNQSAMPVVYHACDLFCLPSQGPGESWGLAVNEAMAAGKAVLVSDKVGCAADLVKIRKNGLIFKANDQAELTTCLRELSRSKELLTTYGQHAKLNIRNWNFETIARVIEDIVINEEK